MTAKKRWPIWAEREWRELNDLTHGILVGLETCRQFGVCPERPNLHIIKNIIPEVINSALEIERICRSVARFEPNGRQKYAKRMPDWVLSAVEENIILAGDLTDYLRLILEELGHTRLRMVSYYLDESIECVLMIQEYIQAGPAPEPVIAVDYPIVIQRR